MTTLTTIKRQLNKADTRNFNMVAKELNLQPITAGSVMFASSTPRNWPFGMRKNLAMQMWLERNPKASAFKSSRLDETAIKDPRFGVLFQRLARVQNTTGGSRFVWNLKYRQTIRTAKTPNPDYWALYGFGSKHAQLFIVPASLLVGVQQFSVKTSSTGRVLKSTEGSQWIRNQFLPQSIKDVFKTE